MKALGLSNTQFIIAIIFGVLIGFVGVYASAPHPVEVPVQVITPVPTPPPVVITEVPIPPAPAPANVVVVTGEYGEIALAQMQIIELIQSLFPMVIVSSILMFVAAFLNGAFRRS